MNCTFLVYGLGNEGKSTWINRISTGKLSTHNEVYNNLFSTNLGPVNTKFIVSNNIEKNVDGIMIFLDITHPNVFNRLSTMLTNIRLEHIDVPIVVCGNKSDLLDYNALRQFSQDMSTFIHSNNMKFGYYTISCVSNFNYDKPLSYLFKKVFSSDIDLS
jgi:GTPase SAR1 family protein